jgi:hypothetical protein
MKVSQLIEKLSKCDPNLDVYMYNSLDEGGGNVDDVEQTFEQFPYCKADPPVMDDGPYVLISGE